jgi:hypothetical protein
MLGRLGLGFNRLGIVGGKHGPPIWVPLAGSTAPTLFADFTTEGGTNHYWYNGAQQANAAAWLTAVSGTFSRASAASYTNSSGLLASASSGALRFDYDPVLLTPKGILLEGASTNLLIQSSTFTNVGAWTQVSSSTVSQNATGPDGVANSATTYSTIENNTGEMFQAASQVNGTYTYSLYVKKSGTSNFPFICIEQTVGGADFAFAVFNLGVSSTATHTGVGGGAGASITSTKAVSVGNGWYRISLTASITARFAIIGIAQAATGTTVNSGGDITNAAASDNMQVFGAQWEARGLASSCIPTTTATVTRAADSLVLVPSGLVTATASILAGWDTTVNQAAAGADKRVWTAEVSADSDDIFLGDVSGTLTFTEVSPAVALAISGHGETGIFKDMEAWQAGDQAGAYGGNAPSTGSVAGAPAAFTRLILGDRNAGGRSIWGHINRFGVYPVRATNATLQSLTT